MNKNINRQYYLLFVEVRKKSKTNKTFAENSNRRLFIEGIFTGTQ